MKMKTVVWLRVAICFAVSVGLVTWSASASARTARKVKAQDLVASSALILRVLVSKVDPRAFDKKSNMPFTHVEMSVLDRIAGDWPRPRIEFELPGGVLPNGDLEWSDDSPMLTEGETYVVFVRGGPYPASPFSGNGFGVFREHRVNGTSHLVDQDGRGVVRFDDDGVHFGRRVADSEFLLFTKALGSSFSEMSNVQEDRTVTGLLDRDDFIRHVKNRVSKHGLSRAAVSSRPVRAVAP